MEAVKTGQAYLGRLIPTIIVQTSNDTVHFEDIQVWMWVGRTEGSYDSSDFYIDSCVPPR